MSGFGNSIASCVPFGTAGEDTFVFDWEPFKGANLKRLDTIEFKVTNAAWPFRVDINLAFSTGEFEQALLGDTFGQRYWRGSARLRIDNGFHYILRRSGGWPGRVVGIDVTATDFAGNVVSGHSS